MQSHSASFFDFKKCETYLAEVCEQYEKTAPTVSEYADSVYRRLTQKMPVNVWEILELRQLLDVDGWEQPNYAANRVYHLMTRLGLDTTGQAGF